MASIGIIKAATTIGANIFTGGTLDVTGASTLTGNTNIAGSLTSSDANTFYGATSIGGALTATSTLNVTGQTVFSSNVGIGTTSPYAKLSVVGEGVFRNLTATSTTATTTLAGGLNVGSGRFVSDFSSGNTWLGSGNFGIGTTSPSAKLSVSGSINTIPIAPAMGSAMTAITCTGSGSGNIGTENEYYTVTFFDLNGNETEAGMTDSTTGGGAKFTNVSGCNLANGYYSSVTLNNLPISSDSRVVGRKVYRANTLDYNCAPSLVATINDNTTTTIVDSISMENLCSYPNAPFVNTTGGLAIGNMVFRNAIVKDNIDLGLLILGNTNFNSRSSMAIGNNAGNAIAGEVGGIDNLIIGTNAGKLITNMNFSTLIGINAAKSFTGTFEENTFVGAAAGPILTSGTYNVFIGNETGGYSMTSGSHNVFIGSAAGGSNINNSIVIGSHASANASNQMVIGSNVYPITEAYLGAGTQSATLSNINLNATGGYGTNSAGSNLILAGGKSTGSASGGSLIFSTSPAGGSGTSLNASVERIRITSSGNIGIGTTSPYAKLSVWSAGSSGATAFNVTNNASSTLFTVLDNGRVGVGTTSPWRTLSVSGTVAFSGLTTSVTGNGVCVTTGGEITNAGAASCVPSALQFKKDISDIISEKAKEILLGIKPVQFTRKDNNQKRFGFIADWSEKLDKRLIEYKNGVGEIWSFDYMGYTSVITKFVQDFYVDFQRLVARVSGLEDKLNEQQKEINGLKEEMARLKNIIGK